MKYHTAQVSEGSEASLRRFRVPDAGRTGQTRYGNGSRDYRPLTSGVNVGFELDTSTQEF